MDEKYIPTIFDNHSITSVYNGQTYQIVLIDTAGNWVKGVWESILLFIYVSGQEEYSMLRKQFYDSANIFLVCFAVSSTDAFSNVKQLVSHLSITGGHTRVKSFKMYWTSMISLR